MTSSTDDDWLGPLRRVDREFGQAHRLLDAISAFGETTTTRDVGRMLAAGASPDGSRRLDQRPLVLAASRDGKASHDLVRFLVENGADPGAGVRGDIRTEDGDGILTAEGTRPLHCAIRQGNLETVRILLRAGADPNDADRTGDTPLMVAARGAAGDRAGPDAPSSAATIVRELLATGADPDMADAEGRVVLHFAAELGHTDVMSELLSVASAATLNRVTGKPPPPPPCAGAIPPMPTEGLTPLCVAATHGKTDAVRLLLSAGAVEPKSSSETIFAKSPVFAALEGMHEKVLRILFSAKGLAAVSGGESLTDAFPRFLACAVSSKGKGLRIARILDAMLSVEGEERRSYWATQPIDSVDVTTYKHLLYWAVWAANVPIISVLLAAGADEKTVYSDGETMSDALDRGYYADACVEGAARRTLQRGPAFRARSWAWPVDAAGVAATTAAAAALAGAAPAPLTTAQSGPLVIRVFRPRGRKFFVRLIERHVLKEDCGSSAGE